MPELSLPHRESRLKSLPRRLFVFFWRRPRYRITETRGRSVISVADVSTSEVLQAAKLDSTRFLVTAHHHPRLLRLLQKLEVDVPLRTSETPLQVFRDRKVWDNAFHVAVETGAEFLQIEHLFFGVLALEEMRGVLGQLNLRIDTIHETLKWEGEPKSQNPIRALDVLKARARELEEEHGVLITYQALLETIERQPEDPVKLLVKIVSAALRSGQTLIRSPQILT